MILKNNKQNAFTIVELLIVIVVIGILAAISIVSYNGIQNRARDTSVKNAASQVRTKIEAYNSITGAYPEEGTGASPAATTVRGGLVSPDAPETRIDAEVRDMIAGSSVTSLGPHSANSENTIGIRACGTTGYEVTYFQASSTPAPIVVGTGC